MDITLLKAKIHRAVVTQADLDYVGSITIDSNLLHESGILEYEKVEIADIDNGNRFETYAIAGEAGSGVICLNGAAAKCVNEQTDAYNPDLYVPGTLYKPIKCNTALNGGILQRFPYAESSANRNANTPAYPGDNAPVFWAK